MFIFIEKGIVDPVISSKLGYLVGILIRSIEGSELEKRIDRLEQKLFIKEQRNEDGGRKVTTGLDGLDGDLVDPAGIGSGALGCIFSIDPLHHMRA